MCQNATDGAMKADITHARAGDDVFRCTKSYNRATGVLSEPPNCFLEVRALRSRAVHVPAHSDSYSVCLTGLHSSKHFYHHLHVDQLAAGHILTEFKVHSYSFECGRLTWMFVSQGGKKMGTGKDKGKGTAVDKGKGPAADKGKGTAASHTFADASNKAESMAGKR